MSINRVVITGNVTRDPELRVGATGTGVSSMSVAVDDRRRKDEELGERCLLTHSR